MSGPRRSAADSGHFVAGTRDHKAGPCQGQRLCFGSLGPQRIGLRANHSHMSEFELEESQRLEGPWAKRHFSLLKMRPSPAGEISSAARTFFSEGHQAIKSALLLSSWMSSFSDGVILDKEDLTGIENRE